MKTPILAATVSTLLVSGALAPFAAQAEEQVQGPYAGADLGLALTSDARLKAFPGTAGGGHVDFDPGVRLSLNGGWRFSDWIRAGGELGVISHEIKGADASIAHFPLMATVEFQIPNTTPLVPFFGGGPGIDISTISIDHDNLGGGSNVDGSAADAVFAWQAYAGVRYKINDSMSAGLVYKYFDAGESRWDVRHTSSDIRFGRTHTHAISASFSMDF